MKLKTFTIKLMSMAIAAATAISSAASLSLTNTASAADTDTTPETQSTLPKSLQNGDFESPDIQGILKDIQWSTWYNNLGNYNGHTVSNDINYPYEQNRYYPDIITYSQGNAWFVTSKTIFDEISDNKFYWETTDYNQRVELALGTQGMGSYFGGEDEDLKNLYANATASSGTQFAELVPEKKSSLYQSISTEPGKVLSWSLDHRSRKNDTDIMAIFIGPKQDHLTKASDDANDLFMEMAELIENQFNEIPVGEQIGPIKLYSKKLTNEDNEINSDSVSTTESTICTEEWRCWIVKSDTDHWYNYSGIYTVPEGQTETTLAFTAMTSGRTDTDTQEGNCLDNIQLGELFPLTLTAMPDGTGSMQPTDQSSAAVDVNGNIENNNSKTQLYEKNKTVTITADPDENYIFTGAIVNGQNVGISNNDGFKPNSDGTYTYDVTMSQVYNVTLTFAEKGHITYDANGGVLSNNDETTYSHEFTQIGEELHPIPTATYEDKEFLGWRLLAANEDGVQEEVYSELIPANHSVRYSTDDSNAELTISWDDENEYNHSETLSASKDDAVLLLAVYQQTLTVIPMTRYIGEEAYRENDDTGGTVTVTNKYQSGSSCAITAGDEYTIEVEEKSGFDFDRLYYRDADGKNIVLNLTGDSSYSAKFSSNRDVTVYAEFNEIPIHAHYAFVPEDDNTPNVPESFVNNPSDNPVGNYSGNYGGDEYGNTISTGFFTTRQFSTTTKPSGIWTIQIPENGTYFKIPEGDSTDKIGTLELDTRKSLKDSNEVTNNRGTIYAVENTGGTNNLKIQVFVGTETEISGEGNVQFGLIIDNLYAPNATAGFRETDEHESNVIELNENNSIYTSDKNYEHDEDKLNLKSTNKSE